MQVSRNVWILQHESMLEAAAAIQRGGRSAASVLRRSFPRKIRGEEEEEAESDQSRSQEA